MKSLRLLTGTLLVLSIFLCSFSTRGAAPTVTQVAGGYYHTLFVESDGSLWAMGYNNYGQLGDGTTNDSHVPKLIVSSNVVAVAAGAYHSLFITSDGNLWAMGWNSSGQLGDGTVFEQHSPEQITFNHGVTAIAAGDYHSLYLKTNQLWGMGVAGSLGNAVNPGGSDIRSPILLQTGVAKIAGGNYTSFYIDVNGSVWATGVNYDGQLGDGSQSYRNFYVETFTNHSVFTGASQIASGSGSGHGFYSFLAPGAVISLWGWGDIFNGVIGDNSTTERDRPVEVLANQVAGIASGGNHSLVLRSDSTLWAMGDNSHGDLGDGTGTERHIPVAIGPSNVTTVACGEYHSLFIKSDGSLWGMGLNNHGQLGDNTTFDSLAAERIFPPLQLVVTNLAGSSGTNLTFKGLNELAGGSVHVLSSTNLQFSPWTSVWTNGIKSGNFAFTATNLLNVAVPQRFFRLQLFQIE
jgi:alpha-tubulin suppressor-like RCC1 family protein